MVMVSARSSRSRQTVQGYVSGDGSDDYKSEEEGPNSPTVQGPKSTPSRQAAAKQKGKQPEKHRNTGKLSKLSGIPLDILYEVSYRTSSVTATTMG